MYLQDNINILLNHVMTDFNMNLETINLSIVITFWTGLI